LIQIIAFNPLDFALTGMPYSHPFFKNNKLRVLEGRGDGLAW